jgi:integrase
MPLKLVPPRAGRTAFWYIRGTLYGRTIDASTKARDQKTAQKFKERLELSLARDEQQKASPATFAIAAELYLKFRKPSKQDTQFIGRLVGQIGGLRLSDIRQTTLVEVANELYPSTSPGTRNRNALVPASSIMHYAAENNLCPYIRVRKFKERAPEPRALTKDQAKALLGAAEGEMFALLTWLFYQGWRIGDVLRLQWKDIDLREGFVRQHVRKTDDWRAMPLHPLTEQAIQILPNRVGKVFHWTDKSNLYRDLRPFCKRVGVKFTPHMARHSFATWLANEGVSPLEIMEAGGWKDHKSVLRYAKMDPSRIRSVISKLV